MRVAAFDPRVRTLSAFDSRVRTLNGLAAARFQARQRYLHGLACACRQQQLGRLRGLRGLGRFGRMGDDTVDQGVLDLATLPQPNPFGPTLEQLGTTPAAVAAAAAQEAAAGAPQSIPANTPLTAQEIANLASTSGQYNTPGDPNVYNSSGQIITTLNSSQMAQVAALVAQGASQAAARAQVLALQPSFLGSIPSWVWYAGIGLVGLSLLSSGSKRR
jgi:hypothetical protein